MSEAAELVFRVPGPDEPGYLRRVKSARQLAERWQSEGPAGVDALVDFLSQFVVGESDAARELLWDASEDQINDMLAAIIDPAEASEAVDPKADASSEIG